MTYNDYAIQRLVDRLLELFMKKSTPQKYGNVMFEAAEVTQQLKKKTAPPSNDPLTLEQLREMDGDKIYVHYIDGFYTDEDGAYFGKFEQLVRECNGKLTACELPLEHCGKTWLAYHRKPEE